MLQSLARAAIAAASRGGIIRHGCASIFTKET